MAVAAVGDDQFGEDPTVNELQDRVAALLGKEAALWLPTGTMANQVALRVLTRPGDHVVVSRESHAVWHETGGAGANAGVQLTEIGTGGVFTADEFLAVAQSAWTHAPSADDRRRDREHSQPIWRSGVSAGRGAADLRRRA